MDQGKIVQCIGAVVDVEFSREALPKVYDALIMEGSELTLEVQQQLGDGIVRTIALGSSDGLRRGMMVSNTKEPIKVPVGPQTLGRIMDVLGNPIDEMGYHTHIFLRDKVSGKQVSTRMMKQVWIETFQSNGIQIDWFETSSKDIKSVQRFINYHTKQLDVLDRSFLVTKRSSMPIL